jgi:hypothetical protein
VLAVLDTAHDFPLGSVLVAPTLDKDIKHVAILINGSPKIVSLPIDFEKDLIKMPFVAGLAATMLQFSGIRKDPTG